MSKNGFSFYRAETDRFQDIKVKRLKKRYGCDGYAVYQYVLNEIFRVEGCYIRWTEDQLFDCADYWDMEETRVKEIVNYCAEICLFDPMIWKNQCILTARAIQTRYLDICKLSKKKVYIPLEIMLVEPEQPMRQPEAMPLFDDVQPDSTGKNAPIPAQEPEPRFQKVPETFRNTPENSGNIPEKNDREEKKKTESPSIPQGNSGELSQEEAKLLIASSLKLSATPETSTGGGDAGAKPRNPSLLLSVLKPFNLSPKELEEVLQLARHGEKDNPVWGIINEIKLSSRIKMPRLFLLSRLRGAMGEVVGKKVGKKVAAS